jgi:hypothetical protein
MTSMLRSFKNVLWIGLLAAGLQTSWAFSLLGPVNFGDDTWQVTEIGFNPLNGNGAPPFLLDTLLTGPKNLGEEYRRNTPVMYYACDANFLDYFGASGLDAVDQAFAILNDLGKTNISSYSSDLSEFPLNAQTVNYQAIALGLLDVKSETLSLMMEQLGVADSVRYTWVLHDRVHTGNIPCPIGEFYTVVMRNFDITASPLNQLQYSPYVNGTLYSYFIFENCDAPAPASPPAADAIETFLDTLAINPPVSSGAYIKNQAASFNVGRFFTGLTRDDVAGLRYLLSSNNINTEVAGPGGSLLTTNISTPIVVTTLPLSLLAQAQSIDPATLLSSSNLTGLAISSVVTNFTFGTGTSVVTFLTNLVGAPANSPPIQVTVSNVIPFTIITNYIYTFANIVTNSSTTNTTIVTQTISIASPIGAPAGTPSTTNLVTTTMHTHDLSGDFFIVPTNWCGFIVVTSSPPQRATVTNTFSAAGTTNQFGVAQQAQLTIISFTNHILIIEPEFCATAPSTPQLREGIEKIQFVRANFDSLLGQFFQPITNTYPMVIITNSQAKIQYIQRIVTVPDVTFSAADLAPGTGSADFPVPAAVTPFVFDESNVGGGLAGPGVINSPTTITYNKTGPLFENNGPAFLSGNTFDAQSFIWGSFDESTNDPVVYPNGTSIDNLGNLILIHISPAQPALSNGTKGVPYPATTFTITGGAFTPPFTWSLATGSALPGGLTLSSGGTISGTPTQSGTFDFVVQLTDSIGRSTQWNYSVLIN